MGIFLEYMIFILIILFTHLIAISIQAISGNKYFYGVYINQIELSETFKKQVDKYFKKRLNISLLIAIILYIIFNYIFKLNIGLNIIISTTIYLVMYYILLKNAYKQVKNKKSNYLKENNIIYNKKYIIEDEELTKVKKKLEKKFRILFGICIAISLLSFLYVLVNYKNIPDTIITHWGAKGKPDGFTKKNVIDTFFTNFIDISIVLLFSIMGVGIISSKTYIDTENMEINRRKAIKYLNGLGYSFLILTLTMQSITTVIPVFMVQQKDIPIQLTLFGCIAPIFITVALIYFYIMLGSLKPKDKSTYMVENDDEKWIYGFIYYNKEDPYLMVEKRLGAGWSINMANPLGKLITIIIIITTIFSLVIGFI